MAQPTVNVLLMGVGFFPQLTAGEKNFYSQLIPCLTEKANIAVFSLNDLDDPVLYQTTDNGPVPIYCTRRPLHRDYERFFFKADGYLAYHHRHPPLREACEKFFATLVYLPKLRNIIRRHRIDVIHFMDNFGLAMPLMRLAAPRTSVTFSAANYDPRGQPRAYHLYLKTSLRWLNAIAVYTKSYMNILDSIGIATPKQIVHWGVPIRKPPEPTIQKAVRRTFSVPDNSIMVLWSGFLQQIGESDFIRTVDVARAMVRNNVNIHFVFAFKPESFEDRFADFARPQISIVGGVDNFRDLLGSADVLLSPIGAQDSTVSPPLTWLEAMAVGVPVITTAVAGVESVISHLETGFVASSYDHLRETIMLTIDKDRLQSISAAAARYVQEHYSLERAAQLHIDFWNRVTPNG